MAGTVHLHGTKGATFRKHLRWSRQATAGAPVEPVDLSDWTAIAHLRRRPTDPVPAFVFDSRPGENPDGSIELGVDGSIVLEATDETTLAMTFDRGYWSLRLIDPDGEADVLLAGDAVFDEAITH